MRANLKTRLSKEPRGTAMIMAKPQRVILAFCLVWLPWLAEAAAHHVITPADIATLRQVADAQIAPDGGRVIYSVRTPSSATPGPTRLWIASNAPKAPAQPWPGTEEGDNTPRWSPDGHALAFLSTRHVRMQKDSATQARLWLAHPWNAPAHVLGQFPGPVTGFRWSPDGRQIAVLVTAAPASPAPASGVVEVDRHPRQARVYLVDAASGGVRPVTTPGMFVFDVDWSPDGQHLVVRYGKGPGLEYFWYQSHVAVIDLHGKIQTQLPHRATALHASFSPDGQRVVYGYFNDNGITGGVAIHDLSSGRQLTLGQGWSGTLRDVQWDADGRSLTALGFDDLSPLFVAIDARDGRVRPGMSIKGDPYEFSRSTNGTLAFVASTRQQPEEVWTLAGNRARVLTDTNPQVRHWRLGTLRTVQWHSSRDDTPLHGLLMLPAQASPGRPLKMLVQIHGGPYEAWFDGWLGSWHNWAQMLAAHGYAVFMPNPRGSDGRGDAFATGNVRDWGGSDFQDILDGVDALEKQGIADPARLAIGGWSYGGEMSAWAAGHTDRFRTAIVGAGVTDLATMALTSDVGHSFLTPYFGDPIRDRARYEAHSPLSFVHDVHIPVLVMHGGKDMRVPLYQGEMFYRALREQGTPVEMVRYPGAPHWFGGAVGTAYEEDVQQRVLDWLDRRLDVTTDESAGVVPGMNRKP
jgi:dipeptidyl aminopeptidase/acylaminoacyl peptidase